MFMKGLAGLVCDTHLKAGMTVSNESGYYADGKFDIPIEIIVLVREVKTPNMFGDKDISALGMLPSVQSTRTWSIQAC